MQVVTEVKRAQFEDDDILIVPDLEFEAPGSLCIGLDQWLSGGHYAEVKARPGSVDAVGRTFMLAPKSGTYVFSFSNFRREDQYNILLFAIDCRLFGTSRDPSRDLVEAGRLDEFMPVSLTITPDKLTDRTANLRGSID